MRGRIMRRILIILVSFFCDFNFNFIFYHGLDRMYCILDFGECNIGAIVLFAIMKEIAY